MDNFPETIEPPPWTVNFVFTRKRMKSVFKSIKLVFDSMMSNNLERIYGGGCRGCAPPPHPEMKPFSSYSLLKFVYLTDQ